MKTTNIKSTFSFSLFTSLFPFFFSLFSLIFILVSCSSPTESSKGSLTGTISLEGETDHSGITIALYDLAYLDTTIVRINNQYPQIGVHINQHTEFDHRLQSPVKYTETDVDGSFELTRISAGRYNLVAIKDGWGFKYLYEVEVSKGDNDISQARCHPEPVEGRSEISELTPQPPLLNTIEGELKLKTNRLSELTSPVISTNACLSDDSSTLLSGRISSNKEITFSPENRTSDLTLFPEVHLSGNISGNITVAPDHHLIIDDDTVFLPNISSLTIMPGAVIRINPGIDLTIHGTLTAQGEENNMFTITSNFGYNNINSILYPQSPDEMINSIIINCQNIQNEIIEWAKIQFLNIGISNYYSNLLINNAIIEYSLNGFINNQENFEISNSIIRKFTDVAILDYVDCEIHDNILIDNDQTIYLSGSNGYIFNNYFYNNYISVRLFYGYSEISNNCFEAGQYEISVCASDPLIILNDFKTSDTSIETNRCFASPQYDWCNPAVHSNNFYNPNIVISIYGYNTVPDGWFSGVGIQNDIDASNNFWFQNNIDDRIFDIHDGNNHPYPAYEVIYDPISIYEIENSGIQ